MTEMIPLPNKDEASEAQLDRFPPCLFPASNPIQKGEGDDSTTRREYVEGVLKEQWSEIEPSLANLGITLRAVLKAAWVLTLQCFVSVENICFVYQEQIVVGNFADRGARLEDERTNSNSMLYIIRVDYDEAIQHFLERLESSRNFLAVAAPNGYEIRVVKEQLSRHLYNTAIHYHEHGKVQSKPWSDSVVDLTLNITKSSSGQIFTGVEFWLCHTSKDMALTVLRTFQHIFSQIVRVRNSSLRLQDVDFCSDHDRRMVHKLTATVSKVEECCMHEIILKQCRLHPDRKAVRSWDGDLTYGELDDLSSRLAHHLVELGVHPEAFVLSCFQKSTWAIVTRLAILRAGGAYISINALDPPAYLDSVIRRTNAQVLVSDSAFANRFRHLVPTFVELTPELMRSLPTENTSPACETVRGDNACLVLFTSGSTGQPKGIIQTHQSYATAIRDYVTNLKLGPHTRLLQFDGYTFDISNLEFMVPLAIGGCCCVPGPLKTAKDVADNINNLKANATFLTPTVAVRLSPADVPCLELLILGGESLPKDLLVKWAGSTTKLINQYGMGEVAICCAYNDRVHLGSRGNIGRPASGAIWVVDVLSPEKLMPIGAVGELLIEGPHLSRRYLDHTSPRRTEATFLETAPQWMAEIHPERRSARLYRSGDLGRWNHDGTIDYIGRKDTILKLDGCRIDAVEVEHQARKSLSPKDSIIVDLLGVLDGVEDPVLTAFLYLDDHPASAAAAPNGELLLRDTTDEPIAAEKVVDIKTSIAQSLPQYMIPKLFLLTTWMPRTASNKTDRKKLHMVGQEYYLVQRKKRSRSPSHVYRVQPLPT